MFKRYLLLVLLLVLVIVPVAAGAEIGRNGGPRLLSGT